MTTHDVPLPHIIEETLRHDSPHGGSKRITTRAATIGGTTVSASTESVLLSGSANRNDGSEATYKPSYNHRGLDRLDVTW
ncbi:hypothetical protein GCM10027062_19050 [Nocardioides hungaricus]